MVAQGRSIDETVIFWTLLWRASQPQHQSNLRTNRSRRYFASMRNGFTSQSDETPQSVRRDEIDVAISHERLVLSCWTEKGTRWWRIHAWQWTGQSLMLQASRRMGAELSLIELVPRTSAKAIAATIRAARELRCDLTCAACLCVTTRYRYRASGFEPRDQTRPARPLRSNSSQTKTRKDRGHWSCCLKSSCCCRCISFVRDLVVQTHRGSHQAAVRSAILVDCFAGSHEAVALSRCAAAPQFKRRDQGLHCRRRSHIAD